MQTPTGDGTQFQNKTKGHSSEMLRHHSPDTPLQVKGRSLHYFFVSMVTVWKFVRSPLFSRLLQTNPSGVYPPIHAAPLPQRKQTGEGIGGPCGFHDLEVGLIPQSWWDLRGQADALGKSKPHSWKPALDFSHTLGFKSSSISYTALSKQLITFLS